MLKKIYKGLPRWGRISIIVLLALVIMSGIVAGATNYITKQFGGGVGVSGNITVIAPAPTVNDIIVYPVTEFSIIAGETSTQYGYVNVKNNSAYALSFISIIFTPTPELGIVEFDSDNMVEYTLPAYGDHDITIKFTPSATISTGTHNYSGNITYSYEF